MMDINLGDPVVIQDAKGLEEHGLKKGMKGFCGSVTAVDGTLYLLFQPVDIKQFFWTEFTRFKLDEETLKEMEEGS